MSESTTTEVGTDRQTRAQPETLRLRSTTPIITVNDLQASRRWYSDVLGFVAGDEWKNEEGEVMGVQMRAGAVEFNLNQDDFAKGRDRPKGVGFRMYCNTVQDIDEVAAAIKARGGTLDMEPTDMPWGRVFAVTDPDGFKISIGKEKEA